MLWESKARFECTEVKVRRGAPPCRLSGRLRRRRNATDCPLPRPPPLPVRTTFSPSSIPLYLHLAIRPPAASAAVQSAAVWIRGLQVLIRSYRPRIWCPLARVGFDARHWLRGAGRPLSRLPGSLGFVHWQVPSCSREPPWAKHLGWMVLLLWRRRLSVAILWLVAVSVP